MTLGLSQDSSKICLPEEQVRALFEDAQLLPLCKEEKELYKLVILNRDTTIKIQDELIINLESQITIQDSVIKEMDLAGNDDPWYMKYIYSFVAIWATVGVNSLAK